MSRVWTQYVLAESCSSSQLLLDLNKKVNEQHYVQDTKELLYSAMEKRKLDLKMNLKMSFILLCIMYCFTYWVFKN